MHVYTWYRCENIFKKLNIIYTHFIVQFASFFNEFMVPLFYPLKTVWRIILFKTQIKMQLYVLKMPSHFHSKKKMPSYSHTHVCRIKDHISCNQKKRDRISVKKIKDHISKHYCEYKCEEKKNKALSH